MKEKEDITVQKICKKIYLFTLTIAICFTAIFLSAAPVKAAEGGEIVIKDDEDLLSDSEESSLREAMKPITEFGNVGFVTGSSEDGEASAKSAYREIFAKTDGIIFYIDMGCRKLCIFSDGKIYKTMSSSRANEITNSVYRYAREEDYYNCALEAFKKIDALLRGESVFLPIRYIHKLFIAMMLSSIILYLFIYSSRSSVAAEMKAKSKKDAYIDSKSSIVFGELSKEFDHSVTSSSSSGSSGGGGGGGDSGGGGSSGF